MTARSTRRRRRWSSLNPDVDVVTYDTRLSADNILDIIRGYDVIVDGADNFPSRYLLNDASVKLGIPVVHGSIFRFEGMVSVFHPLTGPTYRDMVPEPPPAELAPSCAEAGVLGVLPGIVGSIQALEAIKVILGLGEPLIGRILTIDTTDMTFRTFNLRPDPANEVTYANRERIEIRELDGLCAPVARRRPLMNQRGRDDALVAERAGAGLANVIAILVPERIVIGGGVVAAGDALLEPIRAAVRRHRRGAARRDRVHPRAANPNVKGARASRR